jgi:hypothetical protein
MRILNRRTLIGAAALAAAATAISVPAVGDDGAPLLESGVTGSQLTDPALAGALPGGKPWVNRPSSITVDRDGRLVARVRGLVIPDPPFNGTNPVTTLAASLVCGNLVVATTASVPFSPAGNALIKAKVMVPARCLAPVVLLNPAGNAAVYIGASGA